MRIDDASTTSTDLRSLQVERPAGIDSEAPRRSRETEGRNDAVDLSSLAGDVSRALREDSPQEIARVERTQEAFQSGRLDASGAAVADSLIDAAVADNQLEATFEQRSARA